MQLSSRNFQLSILPITDKIKIICLNLIFNFNFSEQGWSLAPLAIRCQGRVQRGANLNQYCDYTVGALSKYYLDCRLMSELRYTFVYCTRFAAAERRGVSRSCRVLYIQYRMRSVARSEYSRWAQHYYNNTTLHCRFRNTTQIFRCFGQSDVMFN